MFKNKIVGDRARYVRPHADCKNRKKRISPKNYVAIFAFFVMIWAINPFSAYAQQNTDFVCYALANNGNRVSTIYTNSYRAGSSLIGGRAVTLPLVRDFCHDAGISSYWANAIGTMNVIATRAQAFSSRSGDNPDFSDPIQSWDMSQVANQLGCAAAAGNQMSFPGINQAIALLPQSPINMRIPTLITKMAGENTLPGNLALELYSGAWQFLGILTSFKLFKIFFKGG